jgi:hypothetical protein
METLNNTEIYDAKKAKRIIAFKNRRDGSFRCPHTSNSLSPTKVPPPSALESVPDSSIFSGVPN